MRAPARWGSIVAAGFAAWVLLEHFVLPAVPEWIAPLWLLVISIAAITLGIRERRAELGSLGIAQGVARGLSISAISAALLCAFFAVLYFAVGPSILAREAGAGSESAATVLAGAFAGLTIGSLVQGLVISLVASAVMRRAAL